VVIGDLLSTAPAAAGAGAGAAPLAPLTAGPALGELVCSNSHRRLRGPALAVGTAALAGAGAAGAGAAGAGRFVPAAAACSSLPIVKFVGSLVVET